MMDYDDDEPAVATIRARADSDVPVDTPKGNVSAAIRDRITSVKLNDDEAANARRSVIDFGESGDLIISLSGAEKHGDGMDAYVSYQVTTKTTMAVFGSSEFFVRRRYQDFVWLRQKLHKDYLDVLVPPLPAKKSIDRFNAEFLEKRRIYLERFLRRVALHPKLRNAPDFHTFLEAKKWALDTAKKDQGGMFSGLADSISKVSFAKNKNPDERFVNLRNSMNTLCENLTAIEKVGTKVKKHQEDISTDVAELGPICQLLSNAETELCEVFSTTGKQQEQLSTLIKETAESVDAKFYDPVREYILFCEAAQELLKNHDVVESQYLAAKADLEKKENERTSVSNSDGRKGLGGFFGGGKHPETAKQERLDKLATVIKEAEDAVATKEKALKEHDHEVLKEFEYFGKGKVADMKHVLLDHANIQIEFHRKALALWEELIPQIEKVKPSE